jgi:hypothetical protein
MECWNVGMLEYKSGKQTILQKKNVESAFLDAALQASIFWCFSLKYAIKTRKSMTSYAF